MRPLPPFHRCSTPGCRETDLTQFRRNRSTPSGLTYYCKACLSRQYRARYAPQQREHNRRWHAENRGRRRDYWRERYQTNPEFRERVLRQRRERRAEKKKEHDERSPGPAPE
jgi:hypothetical protein